MELQNITARAETPAEFVTRIETRELSVTELDNIAGGAIVPIRRGESAPF